LIEKERLEIVPLSTPKALVLGNIESKEEVLQPSLRQLSDYMIPAAQKRPKMRRINFINQNGKSLENQV
jgi:hypothetical protein